VPSPIPPVLIHTDSMQAGDGSRALVQSLWLEQKLRLLTLDLPLTTEVTP